jgi:nitrogen fixation NifU-like protein
MSDVRELYQQLIVDHSKSPRNCRVIAGADLSAEGFNPLCEDHVTLFVKLNDKSS